MDISLITADDVRVARTLVCDVWRADVLKVSLLFFPSLSIEYTSRDVTVADAVDSVQLLTVYFQHATPTTALSLRNWRLMFHLLSDTC